jgi:hypothetical protein
MRTSRVCQRRESARLPRPARHKEIKPLSAVRPEPAETHHWTGWQTPKTPRAENPDGTFANGGRQVASTKTRQRLRAAVTRSMGVRTRQTVVRKLRSFADGLANASNRPHAHIHGRTRAIRPIRLICGPYLIEISRIRSVQVSALFSVGVSAATANPKVLGLSAMERLAEVCALVGLLLVGAPCRRAHASLQPSERGRVDPFHWTIRLPSGISQRCSGIPRSGSFGFR